MCICILLKVPQRENEEGRGKKRGGQETNDGTATAGRRRGNRGRAAVGVEEVNVCKNLKRGACGHHTWGELAHLELETAKLYTWREQSNELKNNQKDSEEGTIVLSSKQHDEASECTCVRSEADNCVASSLST